MRNTITHIAAPQIRQLTIVSRFSVDCLVHGPLTATLLLNLTAAAARQACGQVKNFEYRATSPLTVEQMVRLRGAWNDADKKQASLWALNEAGTVCMTAKATLF